MGQEFSHIAIVGKAHAGKTTLANLLVENHGYTRIGFADAVKNECAQALGLTVAEMAAHKEVFRPFWQWYGYDYARVYRNRPQHWVNVFLQRVSRMNDPVVCDDVRFVNEAEALWDAGFMVVRVVRPAAARRTSLYRHGRPNDGVCHHPSETEQDAIEPYLTVPNDGDLVKLRGCAEILAEMVADRGMWHPRSDLTGGVHPVTVTRPSTWLASALDV